MNEANTMEDITGQPETLEQAHTRLGHTAPRVTKQELDDNIAAEYFTTADRAFGSCPILPALKVLTICVLVTQSGFTVVGTSAPASPENFDVELGRKLARENAIKQLWPLMGYALREALFVQEVLRAREGANDDQHENGDGR